MIGTDIERGTAWVEGMNSTNLVIEGAGHPMGDCQDAATMVARELEYRSREAFLADMGIA